MSKGALLTGMPSYLPYPPAPSIRSQLTGGTRADSPEAQAELDLFIDLELTRDRLGIGRYCIEHGGATYCQSAQRCELEYIKQQKTQHKRTAMCDGRCRPEELIECPNGDIVCRRTRLPCVRLQAASDIELWSTINKETKRWVV